MTRKRAPSEQKGQALAQGLEGQRPTQSGEEFLRALVRLSTERVLQEALEPEQAEALGRRRSERPPTPQGYRHGSEDGPVQTAAGVFRLPLPHVRGLRAPSRSTWWAALGRTRDGLTRRIVERSAGGRAQRAIARAVEKARGPCGVSQRAVRDLPERLPHADAALRTRALRGFAMASRGMEAIEEPRRRGGRKTGGLGVWGLGGEGRQVFLTLATTQSARDASGLEGWRALRTRGLQTPVTLPTDEAPGLSQAGDSLWPRARRLRCGLHTRPPRHQTVPPQAWPACTALSADRREAPTGEAGPRRQPALLAPSHATCPEACRCLEAEAEARLHPLQVPARHRQSGRTSHWAERAFAEERRRTTVLPPLWDEARGVQGVCAVLIRVRARWGKHQCSECEQHHMRA